MARFDAFSSSVVCVSLRIYITPVYFRHLITFCFLNRFTLNLSRGKDIAFHLNPRFSENGYPVIVRNSLIGNKWGTEERNASSFPFVPGMPFEVSMTPNFILTQK